MAHVDYKEYITDVADFPKKGVVFRDITPLLADSNIFNFLIDDMAKRYEDNNINIDAVVGIESRGFILGAALAQNLHVGFVPIRKEGKLPNPTFKQSYKLEYGKATLEMNDDLKPGDNVILVDDVLATGGTLAAAYKMLNKNRVRISGIEVAVELSYLKGRKRMMDLMDGYIGRLHSVVRYD